MENWIEHLSASKRLILAWQAPDHMGDRFRWAIGEITRTEAHDGCVLRYFRAGAEFELNNQGRTFDRILALGYMGYPAFNYKREFHEDGVAEVFLRRLPPRSRPDFEEYMRQFRLPSNATLSNLALLGQTEAKLPGDGFSIVDPLDAGDKWCDLMLEIAGFRHYVDETSPGISIGDLVDILPEPGNPHDANAVQICVGGRKIGNINRLQCKTFLQWLATEKVTAVLERLNGKVGRPRAFVFVRVRPMRSIEAA